MKKKKSIIQDLRDDFKKIQSGKIDKEDITSKYVASSNCYVCQKRVDKYDSVYIGNGMYRHHNCYAGSTLWLKYMKHSEIYKLFIKEIK